MNNFFKITEVFTPKYWGPKGKACWKLGRCTPRYSILPGLPLQAASTASAWSFRSGDRQGAAACREACGRGCKRFFGFLQGVERFILGTGIAFGLQLAFRPGVVDAEVTKHHSFPLQESISSNSHQPASLISLRNSRAHISASLPARWCCPQGISNSWQR